MAGNHQHRMQTRMPGAGIQFIRFKTNGVSDPDPANTVDPGGILGAITRAGQSQFRLDLKDRWVRVAAISHLVREAAATTQTYDRAEGVSQVNSVKVRVLDEALVLNADTTGWEIEIWFTLTNRLGFGETG